MPVTIKIGKAKYKSEETGQYTGFNVVGETKTSQMISDINSAGANQVSAVNTAGATQTANARAQADAASASASRASASETNAAASETNAAASETNAATSETNAAASEANAAASEANAKDSEDTAAILEQSVKNLVLTGMTVIEDKTSTEVVLDAEAECRYVYGELLSLEITSFPADGIVDIMFDSGTTPTVLVLPTTAIVPEWFDPTDLLANTSYELSVADNKVVEMEWPITT